MKLVIISDTHNLHKDLDIPECSTIIHCGDSTMTGTAAELRNFLTWFGQLPIENRILVWGNHEITTETQAVYDAWANRRGRSSRDVQAIQNEVQSLVDRYGIIVLNDSGIEIDGIKFHGSHVQPEFCGWGWNRQRGAEIQKHWDLIPKDTNVLISHGPPMGIMDFVKGQGYVGCENLRDTIKTLPELKLHCFGHLHNNSGIIVDTKTGITYVNASNMNDNYNLVNDPRVIDI